MALPPRERGDRTIAFLAAEILIGLGFEKRIQKMSLENSKSSDQPNARKLIYTQQAMIWLDQFEPLDQETAKLLLNSLTLVSHNEFRRNLETLIVESSNELDGPVALYAVREMKKEIEEGAWDGPVIPFFDQVSLSDDGESINAVDATSDQGSEAIVAQIIRQLSKAHPDKLLNHPSREELRARKCDSLMFVDDYVGSGRRVSEFIEAFWCDKTIVSWLSSKHIKIQVVAYSGTEHGIRSLRRLRARPELKIHRDSPTFSTLPINLKRRQALSDLCEKYGRRAFKTRKHFWWGFKQGMSSLVFEHGCPNNTPAILWDPDDKNGKWVGVFPNRTVGTTTASVFPPEIMRGDAIQTLRDVGQTRLAKSGALMRRGELGVLILVILGIIAKGQRKRAVICYATGLSSKECEAVISKCIKWQFLTPERRITPRGLSELTAAKRMSFSPQGFLAVGSDYYYPRQLRAVTYD